jgi:hypothetical protein
MNKIKTVDYIYDVTGKISEAVVTYMDGSRRVVKTEYELHEVQLAVNAQQRQVLIENPPGGKPV